MSGQPSAYSDAGDIANNSVIERTHMLWTIVVILMVLWLLGLVTSTSMGGLIHILLVVAVVMVLFNLFQGRRAA